jgi:hypothetical protein
MASPQLRLLSRDIAFRRVAWPLYVGCGVPAGPGTAMTDGSAAAVEAKRSPAVKPRESTVAIPTARSASEDSLGCLMRCARAVPVIIGSSPPPVISLSACECNRSE